MKTFLFGEGVNEHPAIKYDRLKTKLDSKFSATEMLTLVRYFGLLVGNLVPYRDRVSKLYLLVRQILDIILAHRVYRSESRY